MLPRRLVLAPVAALAAVLLAAPPAQAALTGTISAEDVVLRNKCRHQPVAYDLALGPEIVLWQIKLSLVGPTGRTSEGIDLTSVDGDPTSGTVRFLICGSYDPGTYTVRTTGSYQVLPVVNLPVSVADTTFEVRRAASRTGLSGTHLSGHRYRLVAQVEGERRQGFKPTNSAEVAFERRVDGAWKVIKGSGALTDHGIATSVVSVASGTRVRAVTQQAGYLDGSTSKPVKVHP